MAYKCGLTLINDGEVALLVPFGVPVLPLRRAFIVRRAGLTQQQFLSKYPVIQEVEVWVAALCKNQRVSEEELEAVLRRAHLENEPRRLLRKLIAVCRENSMVATNLPDSDP